MNASGDSTDAQFCCIGQRLFVYAGHGIPCSAQTPKEETTLDMRLLLINGNTTAAITERCAAAARAAAGPGTEIVPLTASRGPKIIGTRAENALAAAAVIELLAQHAGSADAALIAISFDTALDGAREAAAFRSSE